MKHCTICYMSPSVRQHCGCLYCLDCLLGWLEEQDRGKTLKKLKCLNPSCVRTFTIPQLLRVCQKQPYQGKLQSILMQRYLKNSDVRPCPSGNCNSYGFIDKLKCNEELQCNDCFYKWSDYQMIPLTRIISLNITNFRKNLGNQIFYWFNTQQCPKCSTNIEKNGGCSHMKCRKCKHNFCWHCKSALSNGHDQQCRYNLLIYDMLVTALFINLLHSIGLLYYILVIIKYLLILILPHLTLLAICQTFCIQAAEYVVKNSIVDLIFNIYIFVLLFSMVGLVFAYICNMLLQEFIEFTIYHYITLITVEAVIGILSIITVEAVILCWQSVVINLQHYLQYLLIIILPLAIVYHFLWQVFGIVIFSLFVLGIISLIELAYRFICLVMPFLKYLINLVKFGLYLLWFVMILEMLCCLVVQTIMFMLGWSERDYMRT